MDDEKPLTGQESLELIARMISKAKCEYHETGISALLWGSIITFCSIVSFIGFETNTDWLNYVWFLTIAAVVVQIFIVGRENRNKQYRSYGDASMSGIWISFGISIFLVSFYGGKFQVPHENALFLIAYGIPTVATGVGNNFKPMLIGGIACWLLAIGAMYTPDGYTMLYTALGAQLAWFIPGLILRKRYLKAKSGNV